MDPEHNHTIQCDKLVQIISSASARMADRLNEKHSTAENIADSAIINSEPHIYAIAECGWIPAESKNTLTYYIYEGSEEQKYFGLTIAEAIADPLRIAKVNYSRDLRCRYEHIGPRGISIIETDTDIAFMAAALGMTSGYDKYQFDGKKDTSLIVVRPSDLCNEEFGFCITPEDLMVSKGSASFAGTYRLKGIVHRLRADHPFVLLAKQIIFDRYFTPADASKVIAESSRSVSETILKLSSLVRTSNVQTYKNLKCLKLTDTGPRW